MHVCYSNISRGYYLRAATVSFSTSRSVATIREWRLIKSGVWLSEYSMCFDPRVAQGAYTTHTKSAWWHHCYWTIIVLLPSSTAIMMTSSCTLGTHPMGAVSPDHDNGGQEFALDGFTLHTYYWLPSNFPWINLLALCFACLYPWCECRLKSYTRMGRGSNWT